MRSNIGKKAYGPAMRNWFSAVGEMESISSIAGYYYDHPGDVFPEFGFADRPFFAGRALGHPMVPEDHMVSNDVYLAHNPGVLVVSGSNDVREEHRCFAPLELTSRAGAGWSTSPRTATGLYLPWW